MKELFIDREFKSATLRIIEEADRIIEEYQEMGFALTLRQLYYQFVARGILPNKQTEYKRLGSIINDARLAGLLDWDAIEDRTRNVRKANTWDDPQQILNAVAQQYQENPWQDQPYAPEVWIEKDALIGVIEPICNRMRLPYFACRGYASQSEVYAAGKRFAQTRWEGKIPVVFHLGDHDPSGIDMTRDNASRLSLFSRGDVEVHRLALNMDQVDHYNPPPNPAKDTDSRAGQELADGSFTPGSYRDIYGESSWELDALDPPVIEALIQSALDAIIDPRKWAETMENEEANKADLERVSEDWEDVAKWLRNRET